MIRNTRQEAGFRGYVTSDSDSINDATHGHHYTSTPQNATALGLTDGQCDINSGDTYYSNIPQIVDNATFAANWSDVDRALFNSLRQRFDLGLFDPKAAYDWPDVDQVGSNSSYELTLTASLEALVLLRNDQQLLPLDRGKHRIAVVGPHANAEKVLVQPYNFNPVCRDGSGGYDCLTSPAEAIARLNTATAGGPNNTAVEEGCDLYFANESNISKAVAVANASDVVGR